MPNIFQGRFQMKRDTAANWSLVEATFVPLAGEIIVYTDTHKIKAGDGVTTLGSLPAIGGGGAYADLTGKPIYVTQTVLENDQTGTTGMLMGQTVYKIANSMATLEQLIGGTVNGSTPLTDVNVMDVTSALASYGVTANVVAYSPNNFTTNPPQFALVSCDAAIDVAGMYTNIPSAGVWVLAAVESVELKPEATIDDLYATFFLPDVSGGNNRQTVQVSETGAWTAGAEVPISGVTSWREIQRNVKLGRGPTLYPVHTILNVRHKKFGSIPFEVVAHDIDEDPEDSSAHTMTLLMLEGLYRDSQSYAFDEREKICVCSSGLAAGHYYVDNVRGRSNGTWGFTLTEAVPSGGYLAYDIDYYNTWDPLSVTSYESNGTVIETVAVTANDDSGTDLTTVIDDSDMNSTERSRYGSSNWKQSALRQWLNAAGANWWEAKTKFDLAPNYAGDDGFLGGLDSEFVGVLLATEQVTSTNNIYEIGDVSTESSYTLTDRFFLAGYTQIGGDPWGTPQQAAEGTLWPAFSGLSTGDELARVKFKHGTIGTANTAVWWWLRSPRPSNTGNVRSVYTGGNSDYSANAYDRGEGVAAACVI